MLVNVSDKYYLIVITSRFIHIYSCVRCQCCHPLIPLSCFFRHVSLYQQLALFVALRVLAEVHWKTLATKRRLCLFANNIRLSVNLTDKNIICSIVKFGAKHIFFLHSVAHCRPTIGLLSWLMAVFQADIAVIGSASHLTRRYSCGYCSTATTRRRGQFCSRPAQSKSRCSSLWCTSKTWYASLDNDRSVFSTDPVRSPPKRYASHLYVTLPFNPLRLLSFWYFLHRYVVVFQSNWCALHRSGTIAQPEIFFPSIAYASHWYYSPTRPLIWHTSPLSGILLSISSASPNHLISLPSSW